MVHSFGVSGGEKYHLIGSKHKSTRCIRRRCTYSGCVTGSWPPHGPLILAHRQLPTVCRPGPGAARSAAAVEHIFLDPPHLRRLADRRLAVLIAGRSRRRARSCWSLPLLGGGLVIGVQGPSYLLLMWNMLRDCCLQYVVSHLWIHHDLVMAFTISRTNEMIDHPREWEVDKALEVIILHVPPKVAQRARQLIYPVFRDKSEWIPQ